MINKLFNFPGDFEKREPPKTDPGIFEKVEEKLSENPCGDAAKAAAGYGEPVNDCNNVPENVKQRIADETANRLADLVIRNCERKGCQVGEMDQPYYSESCRKNHYAVVMGCRFTCVK